MLLLVAAILVVLLVSMTTYEHMTNKDLMSALKNYGTEDKKDSKKKDTIPEAPIYGPKVAPVQQPSPTKSTSGDGGSGVYPEIYGPDVVATPGEKIKHAKPGKHESDKVEDDTYDYNPDLKNAFPTNGPPQPFLTDFSKFQK